MLRNNWSYSVGIFIWRIWVSIAATFRVAFGL